MNLRTLGKYARQATGAIQNGRREVQNLRDGADVALGLMDALEGVTGNFARNPSVGAIAGTAAAFASRFMPQEQPVAQAKPVQTRTAPQKPKRVTVEVIDAEIVDEPRRNSR
jgi:hypothetical protein